MAEQEIKKIAIIFSGGMVRGAAQMTFAKEIIKATGIERICLVTGSSIGAMNAYAIGVNNIDRLLDIYNDIDCDNVRHFMRKIRNDLFNDAFNKIEREEIIVPTYVTATKLWGFDCHYFCLNKMPREDIKAAINASMGFPLINGSQKFAHHRFVDGGATDNVPVYPCMYYDPDMIIILHCYSRYYPPTYLFEKLNNPIIIDIDITKSFPEGFSPFSFSKTDIQFMMKTGQKEGEEFAKEIFPNFIKSEVRERCFRYINKNIPIRREKSWNGYMEVVDVINSLYEIKEGIN